jgi:hypothetical protein
VKIHLLELPNSTASLVANAASIDTLFIHAEKTDANPAALLAWLTAQPPQN